MRCMMRCMQRTNIYLERRQTQALDRLAAAEGVTRAEIIRRLLDRGLEGGDELSADLAAIDASFGAIDDDWAPLRGDDERQRHLDALWGAA